MSEKEKIQFLKSQILSKRNQINKFKFKNKENREVWSTFKNLASEPHECLGAYVISMTSSVSTNWLTSFISEDSFFGIISTNKSKRIERTIKRDNLSLENIQNRIYLQMSESKKKKLADIIIYNNGTISNLYKKLETFYLETIS